MAGMNPTAVASAGRMTSVTSMGIMLPVAASGAILMPWVIGMVAEGAGLAAGMMTNIIPCVGLVLFAHPRGTAAGRIKKTRRAAAHAAALLVIRSRGPFALNSQPQ